MIAQPGVFRMVQTHLRLSVLTASMLELLDKEWAVIKLVFKMARDHRKTQIVSMTVLRSKKRWILCTLQAKPMPKWKSRSTD